jgi:cytochrome c oxidase subunit 3
MGEAAAQTMAKRVVEAPHRESARRVVGWNGGPPDGMGRWPGPGGDGALPLPAATAQVGLWVFLTAVTMLFIAFTASYLSRRNAVDWTPVPLPSVLWVNTSVLLLSSLILEWTRRRGASGDARGLRTGLALVALLGVIFVVGQVAAWRQLAAAGLFMQSNPHSAFFFLLTAVHGVHLVGGLAALGVAIARAQRWTGGSPPPLGVAATYWHYLDALWLYIFAILFFL